MKIGQMVWYEGNRKDRNGEKAILLDSQWQNNGEQIWKITFISDGKVFTTKSGNIKWVPERELRA